MICPKCSTQNDDDYIFCVNCGTSIPGGTAKTEEYPSVATVVGATHRKTPTPPTLEFQTPVKNTRIERVEVPPTFEQSSTQRSTGAIKWIVLGLGLMIIAAVAMAGALIYFNRNTTSAEVLPDHLGLFVVDAEKKLVNELAKREYTDAKSGRDAMMKESTPPTLRSPNDFILYADPAEIKADDLKLVRLDSIKDEGTVRHIDFQTSLVEGKPAMKRIKLQNGLMKGKYAFALFSGPFDEGKHKFWAFEIDGSGPADSLPPEREFSIPLKEKKITEEKPPANTNVSVPKTEKPTVDIPVGARVAYCNASDVIVRVAPSLTARKMNGLRRGQKVYLLSYSDNYDNWKGIRANWAYIQTESGRRGWVFTPFITY